MGDTVCTQGTMFSQERTWRTMWMASEGRTEGRGLRAGHGATVDFCFEGKGPLLGEDQGRRGQGRCPLVWGAEHLGCAVMGRGERQCLTSDVLGQASAPVPIPVLTVHRTLGGLGASPRMAF